MEEEIQSPVCDRSPTVVDCGRRTQGDIVSMANGVQFVLAFFTVVL